MVLTDKYVYDTVRRMVTYMMDMIVDMKSYFGNLSEIMCGVKSGDELSARHICLEC